MADEDPEQRIAALAAENEQLRGILEALPEGLSVRWPDGQLLYMNPEGARRTGAASAAEAQATSLPDLWGRFEVWDEAGAPMGPEQLPYLRVLGGAESAEVVLRGRSRLTGEDHWWQMKSRASRTPDGRLRSVVSLWYDVTATRRAQESLRLLAEAGRVLSHTFDVQAMLAGFSRLLLPALGDQCILYLYGDDGLLWRAEIAASDPARVELLRALDRFPISAGPDQPLGQTLGMGTTLVFNDLDDSVLQAAAQSPEHLASMRRLAVRSTLLVPLLAHETLIGAIGLGMAGSGRRFSAEDVALAEELGRRAAVAIENARLYQRAQQAIRLRDEFLQVAAHELKTPITSLRLGAQLLLRRLDTDRPMAEGELRQALGRVDAQAEKLARLVAKLLDVARIEAGRLQLEPRPEDLAAIVKRTLLAYPGALFTLRAPEAVPLRCDPLRLEQVITNLLDNALRFGAPGAAIEVEVEVARDATGFARLSVTDQGIGIAPEHRGRIFDRFYQAHRDIHASGMGLGLYISREIVGLHGGEIRAEFPDGGGTRIVVVLPTGGPS